MVNYYLGKLEEVFRKDRKYCFLIGAGVSMDSPSSIPSAREMGRMLLEHCAMKDEVENLLALPALKFEMIVEYVQFFFDKDLKFLDFFETGAISNLIHYFLAHMIIEGHSVITTNFDYCIEQALLAAVGDSQKKRIFPIITKADYKECETTSDSLKNRFLLVKIHGSKKNKITGEDTSGSLVTTIAALGKDREAGKTFAIEVYKKPIVEKVTKKRTLIVMGYSGSDDFDIGPLLRELHDLAGIVWIEHDAGQNELESVEKRRGMLLEIEKLAGVPITLIPANTGTIIKNSIWGLLLPKIKIPMLQDSYETKTDNFNIYIHPIFGNADEVAKCQLTEKLYMNLGQYDAVVRVSNIGRELAKKAGNLKAESFFLNESGLIFKIRGDYNAALKNYTEGLNNDKKIGDLRGMAIHISNLGELYRGRGDYDAALAQFSEALNIDEQLSDLPGKSIDLNNIGHIHYLKGNYEIALKNYTTALSIDEQLGNLSGKATRLGNIGSIYHLKGDYSSALTYYTEALKIDETLGDLSGIAARLNNIGEIHRMRGEFEIALKKYSEALAIAEKLGNLHQKTVFLNNIGLAYKSKGNYDAALRNYTDSLNITEVLGDLRGKASRLNNIGHTYLAKRDYDNALKVFTEAVEINRRIGAQQNMATNYYWIATIQNTKGRKKEAYSSAQEALEIYRTLNLQIEVTKVENLIKKI